MIDDNRLSPQQKAVGDLIAEGFSNKEISLALGLAEGTVKTHAKYLFAKLGLSNRVQYAVWRKTGEPPASIGLSDARRSASIEAARAFMMAAP